MAKRTQPTWICPTGGQDKPVLRLYNSLTRSKEVFVPNKGNHVTWYSCGPTVYDASHMGHARSYISFDILRRILSDYFGYQILYVMNITDIDDKIIKRARQNYLYDKYVSEPRSLEDMLADATNVMKIYEEIAKTNTNADKKLMMDTMLNNVTGAVQALTEAVKSKNESSIISAKNKFLESAKDPISEWLDKEFGSTVTDNKIFATLPQYWEKAFHKDMNDLNILPPDVLTRVSEYIPQIVVFIEKIITNGLAYESNGSVYFSVNEFDKTEKHHYAKLVPEAYGDTKSLQEGEGDLSDETVEKRSANDFALWKRSKSGEPSWESPWGWGRPGWHIECSAMATDVCGPALDIHTGGVDLKFPHHDNELAQSEAYFNSSSWVSYFLHTGHLTIAGCKMSKSLKNFITIQDALTKYTATQLRFAFLLHSWKDTLDFSPNTMEMSVQIEKMLNEFFLTIKDSIRCGYGEGEGGCWSQAEAELYQKLVLAQDQVHAALCDNVDTRSALDVIRELVGSTHVYLKAKSGPAGSPQAASSPLLSKVGIYVTDILHIFGAIQGPKGGIGFPISKAGASNLEDTVLPYLDALATFRTAVRDEARAVKATAILKLCDQLRDDVLPQLGVRLEDKGDRSIVKLMCREQLLKEREDKIRAEAEKENKKQQQLAAQKAKDDIKKISPGDMFRGETDKYSQFDDKGLPTHDVAGQELSKGLVKKLQKLQLVQEKKHNEYLATLNEIHP